MIEELGFDFIYSKRFGDQVKSARAAEVTGAFAEWLDQRETDAPFFAEIASQETHAGYQAGEYAREELEQVEVPGYLNDTQGTREFLLGFQRSAKRWDDGLGAILSALDGAGLAEDTLLVVTTDHGLPAPRAKCTLYDPGIETLLMLRYPGAIDAGSRHDCLISNIDVLPTVVEAAGGSVDGEVEGRSFWPLLTGREYEPRDALYAEKTFHTAYDPIRGIRTDRYKYIRSLEATRPEDACLDVYREPIYVDNLDRLQPSRRPAEELYDLAKDPNETQNLVGDSSYASVRAELAQRLARWMADTGDPLLDGPVASPAFYRNVAELRELATLDPRNAGHAG